jgi:hypothetical protein
MEGIMWGRNSLGLEPMYVTANVYEIISRGFSPKIVDTAKYLAIMHFDFN